MLTKKYSITYCANTKDYVLKQEFKKNYFPLRMWFFKTYEEAEDKMRFLVDKDTSDTISYSITFNEFGGETGGKIND